MPKIQPPEMSFSMSIEVRPGLPPVVLRELERRIEDYATHRDLDLSGHQLAFVLSAQQRSLTEADQVELIDWLIDQPGVVIVRLSPLMSRLISPAGPAAGYLEVATCDLSTMGLRILYRLGRLTPEVYLEILGGFVQPMQVH